MDEVPEDQREEADPPEIEIGDYIYDPTRRHWVWVSQIEQSESFGGTKAWRTERIYDEVPFGEKYLFRYRTESDWLEAAGVREDRLVIRRRHYVLTDEDELVFVSAIQKGDVLLDPRDQRWKLVVSIEDGTKTTTSYEGGKNSVKHDPYREISLEEVDSPPPTQSIFSMPSRKPAPLYYNDIERMLVCKKRPRE